MVPEEINAELFNSIPTCIYFGDYNDMLENIEDFIEREMS